MAGYLCLGARASREPLRAEDRALLAGIGGHLGAIARNLQLVADLQAKNALLTAQSALLDSLNERLIRAQEDERRRIAADLHDEALQTAQRLHRLLGAERAPQPADTRPRELSGALIDQLRAICNSVRPPALDELGLAAALEVLARDLSLQLGVPVGIDTDPELQELSLPSSIELILYRSAQETANNSLRHARPAHVSIRLSREAEKVHLCVADDGVGFEVPASVESYAAAGHLGLAGLANRVRRTGGEMRVTSAPGQGTLVEIWFCVAVAGNS
jgi:signal transduction histidine kinase